MDFTPLTCGFTLYELLGKLAKKLITAAKDGRPLFYFGYFDLLDKVSLLSVLKHVSDNTEFNALFFFLQQFRQRMGK